MYGKMKDHLSKTLAEIKEAGLYKEERLHGPCPPHRRRRPRGGFA